MRSIALILSVLALLLAGCSGDASTKPMPWSGLTYHMTGGIAGFDRLVTIGSDGAYTVAERGRSEAKGKLSPAALKQLGERIAGVQWRSLQPKYVDPRIADAIFETVKVTTKEKVHTVEVGTGGAPPAALSELLDQLKTVGK